MKKRLDKNLNNDSVDNSYLLGTKHRLVEEVEMDDTLTEDNWVTDPIFYDDDFKEEGMRVFWEDEFKKAHNLKGGALQKWAEDMKEYLDDFTDERYYVRDEIAEILDDIIRTGRLDGGRVDECEQKPIKEAEGMYSKINKWIADTEKEIAEKKKQLKATDDDDEKDILMNDISNLEIHLGDLEAQLDELDYIDNGDPALRDYYEAMEKRLDEEDEDTEEVEWEVIWHPEEWDMQEHDANIESFDDFEKYKAHLKELKDGNEPIIIVSANSYNKDGEIVRMDLDMSTWDEDEYDFDDDEDIEVIDDDEFVADDVDESLNEGDVGDVQVDEVVDIIDSPLDELPNSIEPIFEFESGNYVYIGWDENSKSLIAGGATNTGIIPEFEHKYDFDMSLEDNLQELYDKIIAEHPEYLEPVDGDEGEGEEIEAKVEVEEESLKEDKNKLPTEVTTTTKEVGIDESKPIYLNGTDEVEEKIGDWLSDKFGFCHKGFKFDIVDSKVKITDIDWDLEESLNEDKPPVIHDFCDDEEKMADFKKLSKDEFLKMYSYLTPEEYEATVKACAKKESLEESSSDVRPTEEQKKIGRDDGWDDFEVEHGYGIFQAGWDHAPLDIVCRIDIMDVFPGDLEAVEQAKRDGYKFIKLEDWQVLDDALTEILPEQILDTEENRKNLENYLIDPESVEADLEFATSDLEPGQWYESYLKEERDLSKIEGTISKYLDDNSAELFAGVSGGSKDGAVLAKNAINLLQKAIDEKLISDSEIPHAKLDIIKIKKSLAHNKLNSIMGLVTSLLTGKALEKPVDECKKNDKIPVKEENKMTNKTNYNNEKKAFEWLVSLLYDDRVIKSEDDDDFSSYDFDKIDELIDNNPEFDSDMLHWIWDEMGEMGNEVQDYDKFVAISGHYNENDSLDEGNLPDTDDEEGAPKEKYYNKLKKLKNQYSDKACEVVEYVLEEADDLQDCGKAILENLDTACIYYKDCWDYLWEHDITDFKEAIDEGANNLCAIAYHYLAEEVYDLASKIGLNW